MSNSGDSLIISLFAITSAAAIILIGTFTFSRIVLRRYSAVVHRLYNLSFKGVDTERKRIASELHDQLGAHWVRMSHNFERLKTELNAEQLIALNQLEVDYQLFKDKTHQIVEFMYPKGLATPNWKTSFKSMALQMSMGNVRVFLSPMPYGILQKNFSTTPIGLFKKYSPTPLSTLTYREFKYQPSTKRMY